MSKEVEQWMKRTLKKGPFYLYSVSTIRYLVGRDANGNLVEKDGFRYVVLWKERGKTKFGCYMDGMSTRYGNYTYATMAGDNISGLWQSCAGMVSEDEINAMIDVAKGITVHPLFDPRKLKDLTY